jgi:hypothetical protein
MPYPRSRSYATPEETFGITQKPLNDWFDAAASGMTRTGMPFSQSFEDADLRNQQRELEQEKLRRQLESEQAAAEFLQNAAGAKPNALMRMIAEDPAILGSQDAPMIRDYVAMQQQRQEQRRAQQPFSNRSLGPALMKQLEPQDQAMFADLTQNQGMEATEAMRTVKDFRAKEKSQLKLSELEQEAAKMNVPMPEIIASRSDANPALYLSRLIGQATAATKTTGTRGSAAKNVALDELERYETLYSKAIESDSPMTDFYARKIKQLADQLDEKPAVAGNFAGSLTYNDGAAKPAATETKQPAVAEAEEALSPFEEQLAKTSRLPSQAAQELNRAWTEAKSKPLSEAPAAEGLSADRLFGLAKSAVVGGPVEGTQQEQQLAKLVANYAKRAASGGKVLVGVESRMIGPGESTPENIYETPGKALLKKLGSDPNKEVIIPKGGVFGDKRMKAWELMDLYLKEVGQPLNEARAASKVAAEDSEEDPIIEAALQVGRTGQLKKD